MSNPENGIYIGKLNEDLDLVWYHNKKSYGIYWTEKPILFPRLPEGPKYNLESLRFLPTKWPHKEPIKTGLIGLPLKNWSKYGNETEEIIQIGSDEGYDLSFEGNIRPAIIEILDSIRLVHKELGEELEDENEDNLIVMDDWNACDGCECYNCYEHGSCGSDCNNPNKQCNGLKDEVHVCNYDSVNEHELCRYKEDCVLRSD